MFYRKLFISLSLISFLVACIGVALFSSMGGIKIEELPTLMINVFAVTYTLLTPLLIYFVYETRNPEEYYFYYNVGLSKVALWGSSMITSLVTSLIIGAL